MVVQRKSRCWRVQVKGRAVILNYGAADENRGQTPAQEKRIFLHWE